MDNGQILSRTIRCPYSSTTTTMNRQSKAASVQYRTTRKRKRNDNDMQKGISRPSRQQVC